MTISDDAFRAGLVSHGAPELMADGLLGAFVAMREHEFSHVDPTLATLLRRDPTSFRDVLALAT